MKADEQKKKVSLKKPEETAAVSALSAQGKKVSLNKQPAVEPTVSSGFSTSSAQGKRVSLDKQPAVEPIVSPVPSASSAQGEKVFRDKQPAVEPAVSSAHPVSEPISTLPASSATVSGTESVKQDNVRPVTDAGNEKKKVSSGRKIIGVIVGIIIIAVVIVLLLRNCAPEKREARAPVSPAESVQPSQETPREPEPGSAQEAVPAPEVAQRQEAPRQPESLSGPGLVPEPKPPESSDSPVLSYSVFHFMGDSNSFFPGLNYEGRLSAIAQDITNILKVKPGQIFLISGYSADIPGHTQGEMELSTQRADRVKNSLVQLGVPQANLECAYRGGTNKWGDNISEETRSPNRVVTIELKN
jgi:outer membrane protein OmpA-like peptidoglycan-associated protein